ncbi:MAG: hypothetical protein IJR58_08115, partial [Lachnospiraceae bacterium]|nr:hypothetical protein [Lachnospiraceae bacterium]
IRVASEVMIKQIAIIVRDAVMDGPDIISGVLVDVMKDEDIISYRASHPRTGFVFRRTTQEAMSGIAN